MTGKQLFVWLPTCCLICACGLLARADEPVENSQPAASAVEPAPTAASTIAATTTGDAARAPEESPVDLAILLDEHMLLLRLQVKHGDVPFIQLWQKFATGKFDSADKDHNGVLDADEFIAVKPLVAQGSPNGNNRNTARAGRRRNEAKGQIVDAADDSDDGHDLRPGVTRDEFVEFLRKTAIGPVQITGAFEPSPASRVLFARLDTDHDEKLSAGECERAFDTLHPLDLEEADLFSQNQLLADAPDSNSAVRPGQAQQPSLPSSGRLAVKLLRFSKAGPSLAWADRIRQHFAPAGSKANVPQHVGRSVLLHDEASFATIDGDGDGTLDREELAHLMRRPTFNLEMMVNLSDQGIVEATEVRLGSACRFDAAARSDEAAGPAKLTVGKEQVEMTASGFVDPNSQQQATQMVNNLKQFDQDKNDYLDEREVRQFGQINFKALDANGDGKLFFDEIQEYVNSQSAAAAARLVIGIVDHDHSLFESLDASGDQQLSRRELNRLAMKLKEWDRNGDGQLAFDEVPRRYMLGVSQGQPQLLFDQTYSLSYSVANTIRFPSKAAPEWFTEMDRNSDGDISRREFLGTAAQFRQFDTDGDQLIDPDEAMRATPAAEKSDTEKTTPAADDSK